MKKFLNLEQEKCERKKIAVFLFIIVSLTGCALKMQNSHLLEIIHRDAAIYVWEHNRQYTETLNQTIKNSSGEKLGTIYQEGAGIVRKYMFEYANGNKVELITMGDYTWPIKLTQSDDNTLHLFYFAGISVHRYKVVEFNIAACKIKEFGLPRKNDFYSDYYQ